MSRKRTKELHSNLAYGGEVTAWDLYDSERPAMPREWLAPARLEAAFGEYWNALRPPVSVKTGRSVESAATDIKRAPHQTPVVPVTPHEASAWLSFLRGNRSSVVQFRKAFGIGEKDALAAFYTQRRAICRYECDAENGKRSWIEERAIYLGSVNGEPWDSLTREWQEAARKGDTELMGHCGIVAARLRDLEKTLPWGTDEHNQRLCHFATGVRRELYCLHIVRGWVDAYEGSFLRGACHPDDWDEVRGEPKRDENGDFLCRVPWLERPAFVTPGAWSVPLCLWDDRALARFCGMSDQNDRAFRKAAELVNDALELYRPPVIWVKLDPDSKQILRLEDPHTRRVRKDTLF